MKAKYLNLESFYNISDSWTVDPYVKQLTWWVWNKHYRQDSPDFELLDDTMGVLTQLDNMLTGLERKKDG